MTVSVGITKMEFFVTDAIGVVAPVYIITHNSKNC